MEGPLEIILEFARAEQTGDAHAFRFAPQAYIVRTQRGGYERSEMAWDAALLADLEAVRLPDRDPAIQQRIGEVLRRFLAPAGWEQLEQQIGAAVQERRAVHISLRSAAAELYALPWELLTLRISGQCLGGLPDLLIRYEWPETTSIQRSVTAAPGAVLMAWSAAGGAVPAAAHGSVLQRVSDRAGFAFDAGRDVLAHASTGSIAAALAAATRAGRPVAVLHLLCHGAARGAVYGLQLDGGGEGDDAVVVDPARLQQILAPYSGSLRLVVLAACDSGNSGRLGNRIGSTAQMLHRAGIAAVVASRYPLSIPGSIAMITALLDGLLVRRESLERAFVAARSDLADDAASLDWASIQLYARRADGDASRPIVLRPARAVTRSRWIAAGIFAGAGAAMIGAHVLLAPIEARPGRPGPAIEVAAASRLESPTAAQPASPAAAQLIAAAAPPRLEVAVAATELAASPRPEVAVAATELAGERPRSQGALRSPPRSRPEEARVATTCPPALQGQVRALLPGRGARAVRLRVSAGPDGALTVHSSDLAAAEAARSSLAAVRVPAAKGDKSWSCNFTYEWAW